MIRIFIVAIIYLISLFTQAQDRSVPYDLKEESNLYTVEVKINSIPSDKGYIYFAMYASEEDFLNRNIYKKTRVKAITEGVKVSFNEVPSGTYAVTCFHDANDNGRMDFSSNGMPEEDYGMTNNVMSFGPPRFSDAKFEVKDKDLTFEITF
ncbi:MAG: DUF2141 domain-containing protein [Flavobacteriaceae bacterium]|nr:MAG: DUF2141 domain-containing protein [Flavobacteriaceae bacterium]